MKSKRKFYKTIIQVEVLSEEPFEWDTLEDVAFAIHDGGCSGAVNEIGSETLNALETAKALAEQGSDPEFFRLTENGEDTE